MKSDFELKFNMDQLVQPVPINDSTESQASLKIEKVNVPPALKIPQRQLAETVDLTKQAV